jgi:hypothetical protein
MSAGSPGEDSGGEPAPSQDSWAQPADFGQPGSQATPPTPEPAGFSSAAPQDWSASTPASWDASEPAAAAPPTPPGQSAPTSQPAQPPPPGPSAVTPPPWPGSTDAAASQQSAGNGFGPAGSEPWTGQPPGYSQPAGPYGPPAAYYTPATVRTNRLAIAALVCGLAQFLFGLFALNFLLAIPAIICGAIGLRQTRQRGEGGRGLSIAGLVLGILGIVWNVLYVVLIVALGTHFAPGGPSPSTP